MTALSHTEIEIYGRSAASRGRLIADDLAVVSLWSALGLTVSALVLYTLGPGLEGELLTILG